MDRSIYIFSDGKLERRGHTVYFEGKSGGRYLPVETVRELLVFGEVEFNKRFLELLSQKETVMHYFNHYGYYMGSFYPREHNNSGYMVLRQAQHYIDPDHRLVLARQFVSGSYSNMRVLLKYYANRGAEVLDALRQMEKLAAKLSGVRELPELMAIEGNIRALYYPCFDAILQQDYFAFESRTRRPPRNALNSLISFGNSLLYTTVLSEVYKTHLDPRIGFLHATNFRRFSLNLDVAEVFKPILVDRVILTCISKRMIQPHDFVEESDGLVMKEKARRAFVQQYDERLGTTIRHAGLRRSVSYRRIIRMELYRIEKHLMGECLYEPFVVR